MPDRARNHETVIRQNLGSRLSCQEENGTGMFDNTNDTSRLNCPRSRRRYDRCEPFTNRVIDEGSAMSICPHPCPSGLAQPRERDSLPRPRSRMAFGCTSSLGLLSHRGDRAWPTSRAVAVLCATFPAKPANWAHMERIQMVHLNAKANLIFQRVTDLLSSTVRGNTELRFSSKA